MAADQPVAGAVLATSDLVPGIYEPPGAPPADDRNASLLRVQLAHHGPGSRARLYAGRPLSALRHGTTGHMALVDGLLLYASLIEAVEAVHGPLQWAATRLPVRFPGKGRQASVWSRLVVGTRGDERVAILGIVRDLEQGIADVRAALPEDEAVPRGRR